MDDTRVAILLEDLMSQFRIFGEGQESLRDDLKKFRDEINARLEKSDLQNRQEHQQLMQMIKELDNEVQVEIKRIK